MEKIRKWSKKITENSHAMDLEPGVFTWKSPIKIAKSLEKSARACLAWLRRRIFALRKL